MVILSNTVENVLSRIFLEGIARNGRSPQIYGEAMQALERLDKTCLTVNANSNPYSPLGWRRNNSSILVVGEKHNILRFSYTKEKLNGETLITVEEVADAYGNILTESYQPKYNERPNVIRLTEAQFKMMLTECITKIINEIA